MNHPYPRAGIGSVDMKISEVLLGWEAFACPREHNQVVDAEVLCIRTQALMFPAARSQCALGVAGGDDVRSGCWHRVT